MNSQPEQIELQGVRTHNLKNVSLGFPLGKISVVTGVSGSGKSSLVFDSLYGEAYRRYVESLSSYARQYLKQLAKPEIDAVENLPPAIAVRQARSGLNQRSTVGTMTELNDVLRVIFGHLSRVYCCGQELVKANGPYVAADLLQRWPGAKLLFLAPLDAWGKVKAADLKGQLEAQGFTRCFVDGQVHKIADVKAAELKRSHIVVDRITVQADQQARLIEAAELTLKVGRGRAIARNDAEGSEKTYNKQLQCSSCGMEYIEPSATLFNHNHPLGACECCQGFGRMPIRDKNKITPDREQSLLTEGVPPWNFGEHKIYYRLAKKSAKEFGFDVSKPFKNYTDKEWKWLYEGDGRGFDGINGYFLYLDTKKYKAHYRIHAARFTTYILCSACLGFRLNQKARACRIENLGYVDFLGMSIAELKVWFDSHAGIDSQGIKSVAIQEAMQEGQLRLGYLLKMGLGYLSLNRSARTLSGGEVQRINMARSLGSALTGTLFCLDEPSVGLHARDSKNLLEVIHELRDQGNTIVIVEHEKTLIEGAEHLVEIGPGAGHKGGQLIFAGNPASYKREQQQWPKGKPLGLKENFLLLENVKTHNLKNVEAKFLIGGLNVICGVSGSGKTSLIKHTLYPLLAQSLGVEIEEQDLSAETGSIGPAEALRSISSVHFVSQESIGRSTRSTIATYLGVYDEIRKILASTPIAKSQDLTPGFFSFNVSGGRCENCKGLGYVVEDLSFLGEMPVTCSSCAGQRFSDEALAVTYRDRNLNDILNLTIDEAREFFFDKEKLARALDQIVNMGLGYIRLGQSTASFSGGEAQRLKLLRLLLDAVDRKPCCLIFDEPSTGLSDKDVHQLLLQLLHLRDSGHTVIVVEHHLGLIQAADWLLEVGPEAADAGGRIVFQGSPAQIEKASASRTAPFLLQAQRERLQ